ncbi:hypothetical protein [Nonomuraea sp. NPDC002799]
MDAGMEGKGVQTITDGVGWWSGFGKVIAFETAAESGERASVLPPAAG